MKIFHHSRPDVDILAENSARVRKAWKTRRANERKRAWKQVKNYMKTRAIAIALGVFVVVSWNVWTTLSRESIEGLQYFKEASADAIEEVINPLPKIMQKIAQCESGNQHFEHGQPLVRGNTNRTVDVGKFQINSVHFKTAEAMELNVFDEDDNQTFALYLFETEGTAPWNSSIKCWSKK